MLMVKRFAIANISKSSFIPFMALIKPMAARASVL